MTLNKDIVPIQNDNQLQKENKKSKTLFRFFRYTLIKMLKSPSTYILLVIIFIVNLAELLSIGNSATSQKGTDSNILVEVYSWSFYIIYFAISAMYIGFKSSQVIRDEIDDGTLLIFSSLPVSRFRLIVEKWCALQVICLIYSLIVFFIPPLLSIPINESFSLSVLNSSGYFFLTGIIIQLILSTIGVLFSLIIGAKGVIGLTSLFGILSIVGALIPMIYNIILTSNNLNLGNYFQNIIVDYIDFSKAINKTNISEDTLNNLEDIQGWNFWTIDKNTNTYSLSNNAGGFSSDGFVPITLAAKAQSASGNSIIKYSDLQFSLKNTPVNSNNVGIGIFNQFLSDTHNGKAYDVYKKDDAVPSNNYNFNPNQISHDKLQPKSLELLKLMTSLYNQKVYLNNNMIFSRNSIKSIDIDSEKNSLQDEIYQNKFKYADNQNMYFYTDANATNIDVPFTLAFRTALMFNTALANLSQNAIAIKQDDYKSQIVIFRVMDYLNIWQQWVLMWNGPHRVKSFVTNSNFSGMFFKPINYYTDLKKIGGTDKIPAYYNVGQLSAYHEITNVPALYGVYVVIAIILGGIAIFAVYRKDFV